MSRCVKHPNWGKDSCLLCLEEADMNPHTRLCVNDPRHPDFVDYGEDNLPARENCACDNCFYGRDAMALEIIRLRAALSEIVKRSYPVSQT